MTDPCIYLSVQRFDTGEISIIDSAFKGSVTRMIAMCRIIAWMVTN